MAVQYTHLGSKGNHAAAISRHLSWVGVFAVFADVFCIDRPSGALVIR